MRTISIFAMALTLVACTEENNQDQKVEAAKDVRVEAPPPASTVKVPPPAPTVIAKLPFGLPVMPGARVLHSWKFHKSKRRNEAIASFVVKATPIEVAVFYQQALTESGFSTTLGQHNSEAIAMVSGVRENGEKFSVTTARSGSKAGPGESQSGVVATIPVK